MIVFLSGIISISLCQGKIDFDYEVSDRNGYFKTRNVKYNLINVDMKGMN
jgi:hypothetical protein